MADGVQVPPLTIDAGAPNDPLFIGIGEIPSGKFPNRSFMGALSEVAIRALADASVSVSEVDTILLIPCLHSFDDQADLVFSRMVEELGLQGPGEVELHGPLRRVHERQRRPRGLWPDRLRSRPHGARAPGGALGVGRPRGDGDDADPQRHPAGVGAWRRG